MFKFVDPPKEDTKEAVFMIDFHASLPILC